MKKEEYLSDIDDMISRTEVHLNRENRMAVRAAEFRDAMNPDDIPHSIRESMDYLTAKLKRLVILKKHIDSLHKLHTLFSREL